MENRIILETLSGSHLYGTNREGSDLDVYRVVEHGSKITHSLSNGFDLTTVPLSLFLLHASKGTPQALEAMFAPEDATRIDNFSWYRNAFFATGGEVHETYRRTIKNFSLSNSSKQRAHGYRLQQNLNELMEYGRFNPRLNEEQIDIFRNILINNPQNRF